MINRQRCCLHRLEICRRYHGIAGILENTRGARPLLEIPHAGNHHSGSLASKEAAGARTEPVGAPLPSLFPSASAGYPGQIFSGVSEIPRPRRPLMGPPGGKTSVLLLSVTMEKTWYRDSRYVSLMMSSPRAPPSRNVAESLMAAGVAEVTVLTMARVVYSIVVHVECVKKKIGDG